MSVLLWYWEKFTHRVTIMKIFIPRNISWSLLNLSINIGPATISLVQLFILATWLWFAVVIFNTAVKSGASKVTWVILALPIVLICIFVAFFKYSELTLIPFIAKMIKTYFLDTTRKYQINRDKPDPKAIALAKSRKTEHDIVIQQKELLLDEKKLDTLRWLG